MVDDQVPGETGLRRLIRPQIRPPEVVVNVDERRHDRLPGQIDARRARRRPHVALFPDSGDLVALDEERGVFDRGPAIADDEPRALE